MPFGKMPFGKMPFGKMPFGKMPLGKMPLGKMPVGKIVFDQKLWNHVNVSIGVVVAHGVFVFLMDSVKFGATTLSIKTLSITTLDEEWCTAQ